MALLAYGLALYTIYVITITSGSILRSAKPEPSPKSIILGYNPYPRPSYAPNPINYPPIRRRYPTTTQPSITGNQEFSSQSTILESQSLENRFEVEEEIKPRPSPVLEYKPEPRPSFAPSPFIDPPQLRKNISTETSPSEVTNQHLPENNTVTNNVLNNKLPKPENQSLNNRFNNGETKPSVSIPSPSIVLEYKPVPRPSFAPSPVEYPPLLAKYKTTTKASTKINQETSTQSSALSKKQSELLENRINNKEVDSLPTQTRPDIMLEYNAEPKPSSAPSKNDSTARPSILLGYKPYPRPSFAPIPIQYPPLLSKYKITTEDPTLINQEVAVQSTVSTTLPLSSSSTTQPSILGNRFDNKEQIISLVNQTNPSIVLKYKPDPRPSFAPSEQYPPLLSKYTTTTQGSTTTNRQVSAQSSIVTTLSAVSSSTTQHPLLGDRFDNQNLNTSLANETRQSIVLGYNPDPRPSFAPSEPYPPLLSKYTTTIQASISSNQEVTTQSTVSSTLAPSSSTTAQPTLLGDRFDNQKQNTSSTNQTKPSVVLEYNPDPRPSFAPSEQYPPLLSKYTTTTQAPTATDQEVAAQETVATVLPSSSSTTTQPMLLGDRFDNQKQNTSSARPSIVLEYNPDPKPSFAPSEPYPPLLGKYTTTTQAPILNNQELGAQDTVPITLVPSSSTTTKPTQLGDRFDNKQQNTFLQTRPSIVLEYNPDPRPSFALGEQYPPLLSKYRTTTQASTPNNQEVSAQSILASSSTMQQKVLENRVNIQEASALQNKQTDSKVPNPTITAEESNLSPNNASPIIILEYNPDPRPSFASNPFEYPPELKKNILTSASTEIPSKSTTSAAQTSKTVLSTNLEYIRGPQPSFASASLFYPPQIKKNVSTTIPPTVTPTQNLSGSGIFTSTSFDVFLSSMLEDIFNNKSENSTTKDTQQMTSPVPVLIEETFIIDPPDLELSNNIYTTSSKSSNHVSSTEKYPTDDRIVFPASQ